MSADTDELSRFKQSYSRRGLLIRYARGRVSHFVGRQILTFAGGIALWLMNGPLFGIAAICLALLGEAVDCLLLRWVPVGLRKGRSFQTIYVLSTVTAGIQAITISCCIALAWFGPVSQHSPLFAIGFLAGAAINGGLVLPFHRHAALTRLIIYAATPAVLFAVSVPVSGGPGVLAAMDAAGAGLLAYMVFTFLKFVSSGFRLHRGNTLALIEKGRELAAINTKLVQRQKEAQQLSLVARNANDNVVLSDSNGRITWVNDAFTRTTGYPQDEVIGRTPGDLLNGPDTNPETIDAIAEAIRDGRPFRGEILNMTRDGRRIWIETNLVPVLDADGQVEMTVAIERDVTAARAYARKMAEARRAAEEAAQTKADFLATMSHEIRTPMNGVIGMSDMLAETDLSPDQRLYNDTIRSSAQLLLKIINDILDLSKLDAGKMQLSPVVFDLRACLDDTRRLLEPQALAKGLKLVLEFDPSVPARARLDDGRLRQILINLIGNAIKFTEKGSVTVALKVAAASGRRMLHVVVSDTGIGISPEKLDRVFEPFSQADAATTRRFGGTGLGLTISRMMIEAMGGNISVASSPGQGSSFTVTLPVEIVGARQSDDTKRPVPDAPPETTEALAGKRVLVAEDNKVNRLLIRKYLRDLPLSLEFAHDGQQAVEMVRASCPDLVFMDMSMPGMNGLDATRHIRELGTQQPAIVALTANAMDSDRAACLDAGMNDFLAKPVRRSDLLICMIRHCSGTVGAGPTAAQP